QGAGRGRRPRAALLLHNGCRELHMNALGQSLHRFQNAVDRVLVLIAQGLLGLMVAITFVSVVGRTFFNWSVPDDVILAEFLMVALVFLPLGWVQSIGGHLEVTVLTDLF